LVPRWLLDDTLLNAGSFSGRRFEGSLRRSKNSEQQHRDRKANQRADDEIPLHSSKLL
jgi:hypothetical protein